MAMEVLVHLHHVCSGSSYRQRFKIQRVSTESNTALLDLVQHVNVLLKVWVPYGATVFDDGTHY